LSVDFGELEEAPGDRALRVILEHPEGAILADVVIAAGEGEGSVDLDVSPARAAADDVLLVMTWVAA
jgi:hypothetical protein